MTILPRSRIRGDIWPSGEVTLNAPSAAYLRMLGEGLREAHGWEVGRVVGYLAGLPGARGA